MVPDNPKFLKEDDPIRIFPPKFSYAHHKGLIEQHSAEFIRQHPEVVFNIVRPCVVYGPHTDNYLSRFLKNLPVVFLADGRDPDLQFVHEEDLADLFSLLIEKKVPGAFNAAGDGVVKMWEAGSKSLFLYHPRRSCRPDFLSSRVNITPYNFFTANAKNPHLVVLIIY